MAHSAAVQLTERFDRAVLYAIHVHGGQVRKGTTIPYVAHLFGVAALVLKDGGEEDEVIAALLHDAMENQGGRPRLDDIRGRFGGELGRAPPPESIAGVDGAVSGLCRLARYQKARM